MKRTRIVHLLGVAAMFGCVPNHPTVYTLRIDSPRSVGIPVRTVFVQPAGERFTDEEKVQVIDELADAVQWWNSRLADQPTLPVTLTMDLVLSDTYVLTSTEEVFVSPFMVDTTSVLAKSGITLFFVDNSDHPERSLRDRVGVAWPPSEAWILLVGGGPWTIAHELGHLRFNLPDRWPTAKDPVDIMSTPEVAYQQAFLGCATLADLGAPCRVVFLPEVHNGNNH